MAAPPAPARVVVTGHDPKGSSIISSDAPAVAFFPFGPNTSGISSMHTAPSLPASSTAPVPDLSKTLPRAPAAGSWFTMVDYPPQYSVPMHRTLSVDYACVLSGEITLVLDSGEETVLKPGDCLVQRGVNHQWVNRTSEFCRVLFVMVGAEKVVTEDGTVLEETVFKKP